MLDGLLFGFAVGCFAMLCGLIAVDLVYWWVGGWWLLWQACLGLNVAVLVAMRVAGL